MNLHRTGHDARGLACCIEPTWMHRLSLAVSYLRTKGRRRLYHATRMLIVGEF
jgi:hypothetical protein